METRRKILASLLAIGLAVAIAACGDDDDSSSGSGSTSNSENSGSAIVQEAQKATKTNAQLPSTIPTSDLEAFDPPPGKSVYHVACNLAIEGCSKIADAIQSGVEGVGYKFEKCDGGTTADTISQCFTNAVNAKPDAIVVNGIDAKTAGDGYAAAEKAGIPIIGTFTGNDPGVPGVATEVAGDACTKQGEAIANSVIAQTDGHANVLFVGTQTFACNIQRLASFTAQMKKCSGCQVEKLEFAIDAVQDKLPQQIQAALQSNPDLDFVVGTFDAVAAAAADAIRQAGKTDAIKVAGFDADAPNLELIRKKDIQVADITTGSVEPGWAAADAAARAIAGQKLPPVYPTSIMLITPESIGEIDETFVGATDFESQFKKLWNQG